MGNRKIAAVLLAAALCLSGCTDADDRYSGNDQAPQKAAAESDAAADKKDDPAGKGGGLLGEVNEKNEQVHNSYEEYKRALEK